MASIASTCRVSARAAAKQLRNHANTRSFRTSSQALVAHNFTMPALSPTMTEGNIASWKVKEGDSFVAGDVLLEVETDKAQMDVEAQDDGIMAKITVGDGSKAVKVGARIGVLADPDDDLSTLEIPPEDAPPKSEKAASPPKEEKSSSPPPSAESKASSEPAKSSPAKSVPQNKKYPLYPSVSILLHTHNLKSEDINATGPNGRLLKGDVLAFLKEVPATYLQESEARISKLSHLDLSNIKPAAPKPAPEKPAPAKAAEVEKIPEPPVELSVPVSLTSVLQVQQRMQSSLGITLPLSTFIARAIALANEGLPQSAKTAPTAEELFDAVVGINEVGKTQTKTKDGLFNPQIIALPDPSVQSGLAFASKKVKAPDPFDAIIGLTKTQKGALKRRAAATGALGPKNIFSLVVPKGGEEEKRAKVFLERVKSLVEVEPGRLVL